MEAKIFETALARLPSVFRETQPKAAVVLGSGWNEAVAALRIRAEVSYADIPGFGGATVVGHAGRLLLAEAPGGGDVLVFCGRRHWYEGCAWEAVTMPAVLSARLGAPVLLLTNAAGGIRPEWAPGTPVVVSDHLRLSPLSPLVGPHDPLFGPRFPDQSDVYDAALRARLRVIAGEGGAEAPEGVYAYTAGPAFETPAEVRAYRALGADLVGMSTVPEALVARSMGLRVAALSLVANPAAGITPAPLDGDEVIACAKANAAKLSSIVLQFLAQP